MTNFTARHVDGKLCARATSTHDCPRQHDYTVETLERVDALVKKVAQLLPFPVSLEADMGGEFVLQINLGGTAEDEPTNRAGIDPESTTTPVWWIDLAVERQEISTLTLDAAPSRVADWIVATAAAHGLDAGVRS
ncbi:MAG: hypothetical protein J0J04_15745 [Microbacterium sp.]|uniref:hypothetical protein n=1 Tax=Microbacterium sp. TaxID=51671 RepID=UPI001ACF0417|nr:hypothetical protein [Microbacterium sp.]MBN9216228.1 hypothetical protein [Microbacterium sp.]